MTSTWKCGYKASAWIALARPPGTEEREAGRADLARLAGHWARHLAQTGRPDAAEAARRALATYCHALLNSAEFLYVD